MAKLLRALLIASPLFLLTPAQAQYQYSYQQIGNIGMGTVNGPEGYSGIYNRQQIGNTTFDSYSDGRGTVNCTTNRIGNQVFTSCN